MKKKIKSRQLTSKGLLITFEDGTHCLLQAEKLNVLSAMNIAVPNTGMEVGVEPSTDILGNVSNEWFNMTV